MKNVSEQSRRISRPLVPNETRGVDLSAQSSGTAFYYSLSSIVATTSGDVSTKVSGPASSLAPRPSEDIIHKAVLNFLRFQRAMGRTVVRADEVARALSLSVSEIETAASKLTAHGVQLRA